MDVFVATVGDAVNSIQLFTIRKLTTNLTLFGFEMFSSAEPTSIWLPSVHHLCPISRTVETCPSSLSILVSNPMPVWWGPFVFLFQTSQSIGICFVLSLRLELGIFSGRMICKMCPRHVLTEVGNFYTSTSQTLNLLEDPHIQKLFIYCRLLLRICSFLHAMFLSVYINLF